MRIGGALLVAAMLCISGGCSSSKVEPPRERSAATLDTDSLQYGEEQIAADDPRTRIRTALGKLGQGDTVPEDASTEELQALLDEKVKHGLIPREHARKLLKVLESANAHNQRLERMDERLFGENAF